MESIIKHLPMTYEILAIVVSLCGLFWYLLARTSIGTAVRDGLEEEDTEGED